MVTYAVRIAELKSRLSQYLRRVRRGHSLTVLNRETPIARIVPYDAGVNAALVIRQPAPGSSKLSKVRLPPRLRVKTNALELLLQERQLDR